MNPPKTEVVHIRLDPKLIAKLRVRAAAEGFMLTTWLRAKLLKAVGAL
jgi:plasmid stability protein